ncbi:MAG: S16 family serine protease [Eubacterium sp.]
MPRSSDFKGRTIRRFAITTAILSELTGIPIKANVAMTGEISLKGRALPIAV